MNIIPPIPTNITFNSGVVNNESVRRDNTLKETVPPVAQSEKSSAEKGLGSEFDRAKTPGQTPQPVTYEKPQAAANQSQNQNQVVGDQSQQPKDNGSEQSAGRDEAEDRQQQQNQQAEEATINELKQRDQEVRNHEKAHAASGGQYAASPQYELKSGPDGRQYAVDGEVSIDISKASTPEETIRKMQQVKAAALAPADPSPQDLRVAAEATQKAVEAQTEIARKISEQTGDAFERASPKNLSDIVNDNSSLKPEQPDLSEIADKIEVTVPKRSLEKDPADNDNSVDEALLAEQIKLFNANRDQHIVRRLAVIENFYQKVTVPQEEGFRQLV